MNHICIRASLKKTLFFYSSSQLFFSVVPPVSKIAPQVPVLKTISHDHILADWKYFLLLADHRKISPT